MGARALFVHGVLALVGIAGLLYAATPVTRHTENLLRHLDSGSWETVSDRPYLEAVVRRTYEAEPGRWIVSFVAANGTALLLDDVTRASTVQLVGHRGIEDPETLRFHNTSVYDAYRRFLSEAVAETALGLGRQDRTALERLSRAFQVGRPNFKDAKERVAYDRVAELLSTSPAFEQLGRALQAYRDYDVAFAGGPFTQFQVFTDPAYDDNTQWNKLATELPSTGRCLGKAHSYATSSVGVAVDFSLAPRLLQVSIVRPWLSEQVLDEFAGGPRNQTTWHFGTGGDLAILPSRLWIAMPERVSFRGVSEPDQAVLEGWAKDNTCCRLVCEATEVRLDRDSLRIGADKRIASLRSDTPPLLYAIASRRRVPK